MCWDHNLRVASELGIDQPIYLIPIQKISDRWMNRYFSAKAYILMNCREILYKDYFEMLDLKESLGYSRSTYFFYKMIAV